MFKNLTLELEESVFDTPSNSSSIKLTESGTFVVGDFKINQSGFSYPHDSPEYVEQPAVHTFGINPHQPQLTINPSSEESDLSEARALESSRGRFYRSWAEENPFLESNNQYDDVRTRSRGSSESLSSIQVQDLDELRPVGNLGQGASGVVQRVLHLPSRQEFALKVVNVPIDQDQSEKKIKHMVTELKTLHQSACANIISFHGAFYKEGAMYLVLEYMDGGSLADLLRVIHSVPEKYISNIAKQVLAGLHYLHSHRRCVHRDIKPSNILLNRRGVCKLADFGVSGQLEHAADAKSSFVGTVTYMSPERIQGGSHSFDSDLWSLGLTLAECALGRFPYDDDVFRNNNNSNSSSSSSGSRCLSKSTSSCASTASSSATLLSTPTHHRHQQAEELDLSYCSAPSTPSSSSASSSSSSSAAAAAALKASSALSPTCSTNQSQSSPDPVLSSHSSSTSSSSSSISPSPSSFGSEPNLNDTYIAPAKPKKNASLSFWVIMDNIVSMPPPTLSPAEFSPEFCSFISECLQKDPAKRPTAQALLQHPFITLYDRPLSNTSASSPSSSISLSSSNAEEMRTWLNSVFDRMVFQRKAVSSAPTTSQPSPSSASPAPSISIIPPSASSAPFSSSISSSSAPSSSHSLPTFLSSAPVSLSSSPTASPRNSAFGSTSAIFTTAAAAALMSSNVPHASPNPFRQPLTPQAAAAHLISSASSSSLPPSDRKLSLVVPSPLNIRSSASSSSSSNSFSSPARGSSSAALSSTFTPMSVNSTPEHNSLQQLNMTVSISSTPHYYRNSSTTSSTTSSSSLLMTPSSSDPSPSVSSFPASHHHQFPSSSSTASTLTTPLAASLSLSSSNSGTSTPSSTKSSLANHQDGQSAAPEATNSSSEINLSDHMLSTPHQLSSNSGQRGSKAFRFEPPPSTIDSPFPPIQPSSSSTGSLFLPLHQPSLPTSFLPSTSSPSTASSSPSDVKSIQALFSQNPAAAAIPSRSLLQAAVSRSASNAWSAPVSRSPLRFQPPTASTLSSSAAPSTHLTMPSAASADANTTLSSKPSFEFSFASAAAVHSLRDSYGADTDDEPSSPKPSTGNRVSPKARQGKLDDDQDHVTKKAKNAVRNNNPTSS